MQARRKYLFEGLKAVDLMVLTFSLAFAAVVSYSPGKDMEVVEFLAVRIKIENAMLIAGFALVWHGIFRFLELYQSKRLSTFRDEALDIVKACSLGTVILATIKVLFNVEMVSKMFIILFWISCTVLTIGSRWVIRSWTKRMRLHGRNIRSILIVGTNPRAVRFARDIEAKRELGYRLIGFMDEDWEGISKFKETGYSVVSDFQAFPAFLRTFQVDEVMIGLPIKSYYEQTAQIVEQCEEQGIIIRILGNMFSPKLARENAEDFGGYSVLTLSTGGMGDYAFLMKRIIDIAISFPCLVILSPFFAVIALAIKLSSRGPVLFVQRRLGLNKRRFNLYKFRTMVDGAEAMLPSLEHRNEASGAAFKIAEDPRLTQVGKYLRKLSIDELPQLINVLRGDMSLVGPRPIQLRDFEGFYQDWHRRRFSVRPGITCLWQVNGRSNLSFEQWMELDIEYIDRWSLWLDLKILLKTIPVVLRGTGAA